MTWPHAAPGGGDKLRSMPSSLRSPLKFFPSKLYLVRFFCARRKLHKCGLCAGDDDRGRPEGRPLADGGILLRSRLQPRLGRREQRALQDARRRGRGGEEQLCRVHEEGKSLFDIFEDIR